VDYPIKPNVCNLDAHTVRPGDGQLWPHSVESSTPTIEEPSSHHNIVSTSCPHEQSEQGHSPVLKEGDCEAAPSTKKIKVSEPVKPVTPSWLSKESLLYKLRWVTLGYHYDWTSKEYSPEKHSPFPEDLGRLSMFILRAVGFSE